MSKFIKKNPKSSYLAAIGIVPESFKSVGQFLHAQINKKSYLYHTDGRTDHNFRKASLKKMIKNKMTDY